MRLIEQWLSERLGQSFVIENRPGGNSNIGTETVIRALGDGYSGTYFSNVDRRLRSASAVKIHCMWPQ